MSNFKVLAQTDAVPFRIRLHIALLLSLGFLPSSACDTNSTESVESLIYQVTNGACGEIVFVEKVGVDFSSAFGIVEARKLEVYGRDELTLKAYALKVIANDGSVPDMEFYAIRVLSAQTGTHLHSVSEVITSRGDLFKLVWCPD